MAKMIFKIVFIHSIQGCGYGIWIRIKISVVDPVFGRNPDPGKYLGLQRSNLKNDFNPGLRTLGEKF